MCLPPWKDETAWAIKRIVILRLYCIANRDISAPGLVMPILTPFFLHFPDTIKLGTVAYSPQNLTLVHPALALKGQ